MNSLKTESTTFTSLHSQERLHGHTMCAQKLSDDCTSPCSPGPNSTAFATCSNCDSFKQPLAHIGADLTPIRDLPKAGFDVSHTPAPFSESENINTLGTPSAVGLLMTFNVFVTSSSSDCYRSLTR